jgi:predicted component of type VI protein secretion system
MPPQLVALTEGPSILLDKPILLIGRHQECDIQLPSRKVSRRHCCIAQVNDYLVVRDLSSTNGIRINGKRVLEGKLDTGDELTIGNYRYRIHWGDALEERAPPADAQTVRANDLAVPQPKNVEDDELESCDEPIPLQDPGAAVPLARVNGHGIEPPAVAPPILPEDLHLEPISDVNPRRRQVPKPPPT